MIFNIYGNVLQSPFSFLLSIFLCLGVFSLGNLIQYLIIRKKIFSEYKKINFLFSPIIGTYFLIVFLYFFIIFEIYSKFIFNVTSYLLLLLSLIKFNETIKIFNSFKTQLIKKNELSLYILVMIYLILFLIASSPITHADAIDYHFSGALNTSAMLIARIPSFFILGIILSRVV